MRCFWYNLEVNITMFRMKLLGINTLGPIILPIVELNRPSRIFQLNRFYNLRNALKLRNKRPIKTLIKRLFQMIFLLRYILNILLPCLLLLFLQPNSACEKYLHQHITYNRSREYFGWFNIKIIYFFYKIECNFISQRL